MHITKSQKLFGVGPVGAVISFLLLAIAFWLNNVLGHAAILANPLPIRIFSGLLVGVGLGLHFWSLLTLRQWWDKDELCTTGPFRWFRHPLYAAWITFILPAVALYLNSWIVLFFVALMHPVWHYLIVREEKMMSQKFKNAYRVYAAGTGRFFPRIWNR